MTSYFIKIKSLINNLKQYSNRIIGLNSTGLLLGIEVTLPVGIDEEIAIDDVTVDKEMSHYIQYSAISSNIKKAITLTLQHEPIPYDSKGITEEDLKAILAMQEVEQADDAIKKKKKMYHLTEDQKKNIEEKEMKKVLKAKDNQEKQKKESQSKKAKDKLHYKQKDLDNDEQEQTN